MLGRNAKDMIEEEHAEGERAVSNGVEPVGVSVALGSPSDLGVFGRQAWEWLA